MRGEPIVPLVPLSQFGDYTLDLLPLISFDEDRSMKPLLCNFGVMILLLGPFIIIPAMVIGFGLFLFGNEEVALWVCGTAAAVSLILGRLTFRTFAKWERKMPRSLRREAAIDVSTYRSKYKMMIAATRTGQTSPLWHAAA